MSATPILRFSDKNGQPFPEWESMFIGDYLTKKSIKQVPTDDAPLMSFVAHRGVVEKGDKYDRSHLVKSKDKKYKRTDLNDFIYSSNNLDVGSIGLNKHGSAVISEVYEIFSINDAANPDFISEVIQMPETIDKIIRFRQGCLYGQYKIYPEDFLDVEINMPTKEEQDKVATFLSLYDQKIENQMAKVEALETRRKGLLQRIFSQEIRFKADDGSDFPDWDTEELNTYLYENKERNKENTFGKKDVLSVSKDYGVINQIKYQGRSLAGDDISNYHIVHKGNVVYTKSPLGKQPYGIIKASETEGIVSTLYAVYYCRDNVIPKLLDYYFSLDETLNRYLKPLVNIGAKHDMKVNNTDALAGLVTLPSSLSEQQKIVDFFVLIGKQIQIEKDKLEAIKQVKKGLLQQMFV